MLAMGILAVSGAACSGANNDTDTGIPNNRPDAGNNGETNNGTPDDASPDMPDPDEGCDRLDDLGAPVDETIEREFRAALDEELPACTDAIAGAESDGTYVFKVEYEEATRLRITTDGKPNFDDEFEIPPAPVVELRQGACLMPAALIECSEQRVQTFDLVANTPYYFAVTGRLDSGGVKMRFESETFICEPDTQTCTDGVIGYCDGGTEIDEIACAGDCSGDSACAGETCEDAVPVTLTANGETVVLSGNRGAYTDGWSAGGREGCNVTPGEPANPTPGKDFVVRLSGLSTGQTLDVDAEDSEGRYMFFILDACGSETCETAFDFDTNLLNRGTWQVDRDGDAFLVVESVGQLDQGFELKLKLTE